LLVLFQVTENFDQLPVSYFGSISGNPALDLLMISITETGDVFYMLGFSLILLIIKKTRRLGATLMILLVLATLMTGYIKCGVDRDRPELDFTQTVFPVEIPLHYSVRGDTMHHTHQDMQQGQQYLVLF
jgi:undecaprenyl-diphosphatase